MFTTSKHCYFCETDKLRKCKSVAKKIIEKICEVTGKSDDFKELCLNDEVLIKNIQRDMVLCTLEKKLVGHENEYYSLIWSHGVAGYPTKDNEVIIFK